MKKKLNVVVSLFIYSVIIFNIANHGYAGAWYLSAFWAVIGFMYTLITTLIYKIKRKDEILEDMLAFADKQRNEIIKEMDFHIEDAKQFKKIAGNQQKRIATLTKKSENKDKVIKKYDVYVEEIRIEKAELVDRCDELNEQINSLKAAGETQESQIKTLTSTLVDRDKKIEDQNETIKKQQLNIVDLAQRLDVQKGNVKVSVEALLDEKKRYKQAKEDAKTWEDISIEHEETIDKLHEFYLKKIQERVEKYRKSLEDCVKEIQSLKLEKPSHRNLELEEKYQWYKEKNDLLNKEVKVTKKIRDDQAKQINSLNKEIRKLTKENKPKEMSKKS
jgi:DNA repair exonuclease SbcCD ATPase subunit